MSAPFGWSGSPPCYSLFGRAISWLMGSNSPASVSDSLDTNPFFPFEWVDDHILVEPEIDNRLQLAEATLRYAMLAVLDARSINESKFSNWSDELVALGLLWNTERLTISIHADKIEKALNRVSVMLKLGRATKTEFYKLRVSLRHVANCLRTAKPFFQRLQKQCTSAPRFGSSKLSAGSLADLAWFRHILDHGCLAELPLCMFDALPSPNVELYMDTSNHELAILDPGSNSFIQVKFDHDELALIAEVKGTGHGFSINLREHLCIALALRTWGAKWGFQSNGRTLHVRCWSDNSSAVTWCNRLHANNHFSQEINRAIGLAEAYFNLRVSAEHLPGSSNWMADSEFSPEEVQETLHELLGTLQSCSLAASSAKEYSNTWSQWKTWCTCLNFLCGYLKTSPNTLINTRFSRLIAGDLAGDVSIQEILPPPCSQKSAILRGIIGERLATTSTSCQDTNWLSPSCIEPIRQVTPNFQSPPTSLGASTKHSTSTEPSTESCGGASALGFFFLLRKSEYLANGSQVMSYAIQRSDIKFVDARGSEAKRLQEADSVVIQFRGSMADQFGKGSSRVLSRSKQSWCCPVLAAGGATTLFNTGFDSLAVKLFGRWKSDAVERYTRISGQLKSRMASTMLAKSALQLS
ncbi:hypothetical protein PHMEG_00023642 [Phytophthora megakarya]|uniref:Uncharacterized protein n=1 Tax=Phytophthora megakarya TaxID=4795 RepID=A0A225VFV5_9STRA|nr:hypothetical protein PHMEG_00023642 [Phytophthora megakarya]